MTHRLPILKAQQLISYMKDLPISRHGYSPVKIQVLSLAVEKQDTNNGYMTNHQNRPVHLSLLDPL